MVNFQLIGLLYFESTPVLNSTLYSPLLQIVKWSENELDLQSKGQDTSMIVGNNKKCHKINWQANQRNVIILLLYMWKTVVLNSDCWALFHHYWERTSTTFSSDSDWFSPGLQNRTRAKFSVLFTNNNHDQEEVFSF